VKVSDVRTMRYNGKVKRALMGRLSRSPKVGRRPAFKKAIVQLAEGDHIEFYEVG
jgi:large subunit ribosomal protein L23